MKRTLHFILTLSLLTSLGFLVSCSGDDKDEVPQDGPIVGTWTFSSIDFDATINGQDYIEYLVETFDITEEEAMFLAEFYRGQFLGSEFQSSTITFKRDGTYVTQGGDSEETGTYTLTNSNTKLTLSSGGEVTEFDVKELTNNNLKLEYTGVDEDDIDEDGTDETISFKINLHLTK